MLVLAWVVSPLIVIAVMVVGFRLSRAGQPSGDGGTSTGDGTGKTEVIDQASEGPGESDTTDTTAPAAPVNLMTTDPAPAITAFAGIYDTPPRVQQINLYSDYALIDVQVPTNPTYVDEYTWSDGELSGPEPQQLMDMEVDELEAKLFDLAEVDPAVVPAAAQQTLQSCPGDGIELSHVIIERELTFDDQQRVLISVFASNPVRGGGGYVTFTLDGTLVENHCT
jgi:hypothetical protein